jgi:hypothetical protein
MVGEGQHVPVSSQFRAVLPGYRPDNLWKNQDAYPLVIPLARVYQVSRRRLVPSVANLEELFANAAKPGGELKLWDVTTGRAVSTLRWGIRFIGWGSIKKAWTQVQEIRGLSHVGGASVQ